MFNFGWSTTHKIHHWSGRTLIFLTEAREMRKGFIYRRHITPLKNISETMRFSFILPYWFYNYVSSCFEVQTVNRISMRRCWMCTMFQPGSRSEKKKNCFYVYHLLCLIPSCKIWNHFDLLPMLLSIPLTK